jgi:hypothetical protein
VVDLDAEAARILHLPGESFVEYQPAAQQHGPEVWGQRTQRLPPSPRPSSAKQTTERSNSLQVEVFFSESGEIEKVTW